VLQDVFVEALRGVRTVREPAALRAWLARVTARAAHAGARAARSAAASSASTTRPRPPRSPTRARRRSTSRCCTPSPRSSRPSRGAASPWDLRTLEGQPLGDIAARCGCSRTTVKRRIAEVQGILQALAGPHDRRTRAIRPDGSGH
jgi:DNA-directed RNA polymerase specialized sigma24 family protein